MERVTEGDLDDMRARGFDRSTIADAQRQVELTREADRLIARLPKVFGDIKLGDGTGLTEADGIDDFLPSDALMRRRDVDEKDDWQRIDATTLNRCNAAPSFMDGRGRLFHLPAFLRAELSGMFEHDFISRLTDGSYLTADVLSMLTAAQAATIADCLDLFRRDCPGYDPAAQQMIDRLTRPRDTRPGA